MEDLLTSARLDELGFRHGFSLRRDAEDRRGAGPGGDPEPDLSLRAFADAVGCRAEFLFEVTQVHGSRVRAVSPEDAVSRVRAERADALVAVRPPLAVGVRVADCLPLLMADADSGAVAAVHAGWRGVVAGVARAGLDALLSVGGGSVDRVHCAVFPHIRSCCFEVGEEVAASLAAACPDDAGGARIVDGGRRRPHVNLAAIVRAQLGEVGVSVDRIDDVPGCTRCGGGRFHSYRRDGSSAGRHLAAIAVRG